MKTLALDLETFSELDIKKVGLYKYAANCEIILFAYAFEDNPVEIIDLAQGEKIPAEIEIALFDKNRQIRKLKTEIKHSTNQIETF